MNFQQNVAFRFILKQIMENNAFAGMDGWSWPIINSTFFYFYFHYFISVLV